ncbi:BA14K family protein [Rhizobiaceae bacterium LC148]|nr:BA14K family protein [Rhizobiaceae bacterium LC148]
MAGIITRLPTRHVDWCSARYRTYRVSDNTYVPRAGCQSRVQITILLIPDREPET